MHKVSQLFVPAKLYARMYWAQKMPLLIFQRLRARERIAPIMASTFFNSERCEQASVAYYCPVKTGRVFSCFISVKAVFALAVIALFKQRTASRKNIEFC